MADAESDAERRARERVGGVLKDKWRLERVLGVGGFGAVYAATHRTRKRVAIKVLHRELSADTNARARFLREAYAANTIDHPGVVSVFDDDVADDGSVFLVMELCEGETVEARRSRAGGTLPPKDVLAIADRMLDVLAAAHDQAILHRDLKPENLFITHAGQLKLLDFGLARLRESSGVDQTRSGAFMGTPAFMPPEQARMRWREVDERSDLWAVGATLFTLLTGRFVHAEETAAEMLVASMTKPPPRLASVLPDASPALALVIDRALAFESAGRWTNARSMQEAVRRAYVEMTGKPLEPNQRLDPVASASGIADDPTDEGPPPGMSPNERAAFAATLAAERSAVSADLAQASESPSSTTLRKAPLAKGSSSSIAIAIALAGVAVLAVGGGLAARAFFARTPDPQGANAPAAAPSPSASSTLSSGPVAPEARASTTAPEVIPAPTPDNATSAPTPASPAASAPSPLPTLASPPHHPAIATASAAPPSASTKVPAGATAAPVATGDPFLRRH